MTVSTLLLKVEARKKSGWIAALLNLVIPGAGYAYCGRWILGIITFFFVVTAAVVTLGIAVIPFILIVVVDGFLCAERYNKRVMLQELAMEDAKSHPPANPISSNSAAESQVRSVSNPAVTTVTVSQPENPSNRNRIILLSVIGGACAVLLLMLGIVLVIGLANKDEKEPNSQAAQTLVTPEKSSSIQPSTNSFQSPSNLNTLAGHDSLSALDEPVIRDIIKSLIGNKLVDFRDRLQASSPVEQDGEWLFGQGGMQHLFTIEEAAYAINTKTREAYAAMLIGGKEIRLFGTDDAIKLPAPLQNWYKAHRDHANQMPVVEQPVPHNNASSSLLAPSASFDCKKAKSATEILICTDPELSRLDNELAIIYRQAKANAIDVGEFKEQTTAAWKWREANCHNKECLLGWYASRKDVLLKAGQARL